MSEKRCIDVAMVAIMQEAKAIGKDSKNQQQGFNFRGIDAVMNHLHPIFAKHGVTVSPCVLEERTEERQTKNGGNLIYRVLKIRVDFVAEDGSVQSCTVIGEGMDSGDKAANKAMAVALKYALTQKLLLPYDEVDPDTESHEVAPRKPEAKGAPISRREFLDDSKPGAVANTGQVAVRLGDVRTQTGESKNGTWTRWYTKAEDGQFYSTFDSKIGDAMESLENGEAVLTYKLVKGPKGESRDVINCQVPGEVGPTAEQSDNAQF